MIKTIEFKTVSKDLLSTASPATRIRLFNFSDGLMKIDLASESKNQKIGSFETTWIRIHDIDDRYYDFITTSVFFMVTETGVSLLCSEDTEFIDSEYIGALIANYVGKSKKKTSSINENIDIYYKQVSLELQRASKKLLELYSVSNQVASQRLDIEDTYEHGKAKLQKRYLLDTIAKRLIKENREEIIQNIILS